MNDPTTLREPGSRLNERTLEQLLNEAETFGAVEFDMEIHAAFEQAIARAKKIVGQFK